jgi:hypothetical protein
VVMGIRRGKPWLAMVVAAAVLLVGCGGSGSSSAERTKLEHKLSAHVETSGIGAALVPCVAQQAGKLPIGQLRAVANAGSSPPPATKQVAVGLITACIRSGQGLDTMHSLIVQSIETSTSPNVPDVLKQCLIQRANATTGDELSQLVSAYAQNQAAAQAQAQLVGRGLARQCLADPSILNALRGLFISPIRSALAKSSYSAAFKNCVLKKSEQFPAAKLREAALNPAGAQALGEAFGRNAARACIAAGAKP